MNSDNSLKSNFALRKRLCEKILCSGKNDLTLKQQIEFLLTYGNPRKNAEQCANKILQEFESLQSIMNAGIENLAETANTNENSVGMFALIRSIGETYYEEQIMHKNFKDVFENIINFARLKIGGLSKENYIMILLDKSGRVMDYKFSAYGTTNKTIIYLRNTIEICCRKNYSSVIMIHNHPSGICTPSEMDLNATFAIKRALQYIKVNLADHIIVSKYGFHSMKYENDF